MQSDSQRLALKTINQIWSLLDASGGVADPGGAISDGLARYAAIIKRGGELNEQQMRDLAAVLNDVHRWREMDLDSERMY
jgi:hypothetical protein